MGRNQLIVFLTPILSFAVCFLAYIVHPLTPEIIADFKVHISMFFGFFPIMWPVILFPTMHSVKKQHGVLSDTISFGMVGRYLVPIVVGTKGDFIGLKNSLFPIYTDQGFIFSPSFWARSMVSNKSIIRRDFFGNHKIPNLKNNISCS